MNSTARDGEFAKEVVRRLRDAGYTAYWAGGCVRDLLLGKTPKDYDVATDARPEVVQRLFGHRMTKAVGAAFGVILVHGPAGVSDIEVATFRAEGPYLDGRRPEHVVFCTPEQDAQRRDFTINGMFYDPFSHTVFDYVGGQDDLQRRAIRAIGVAEDRFREDKLRILRAIRFAATLGFQLNPQTALAIRSMAQEVRIVSPERIAQEWRRMLLHSSRRRAFELAAETSILAVIFPEWKRWQDPTATHLWQQSLDAVTNLQSELIRAPSGTELTFELVLATWLQLAPDCTPKIAEGLCKRLRLSNDELERIVWLRRHGDSTAGAKAFSLSRLKRLLAHPFAVDLLLQTRALAVARGQDLSDVEFCEAFLKETPREILDPPPLITGDDLIALGLSPGKEFKFLLESLRDAQLEGRINSLEDACSLTRVLSQNAS